MKLRNEKRVIPDKSHYVSTEVKGKKLHFRLPNVIQAIKFIHNIPPEILASLGGLSDAKNTSDVLKNIPDLLALMSYVIGLTWHAEDSDLDTVQKPGESDLEFGIRLFDELYEEGFQQEEIMELGSFLFGKLVTSINKNAKVEQKKTTSKKMKVIKS